MSWTTPKDLKAQLLRQWERGELLRDAIAHNQRYPLYLKLKAPSSTDITNSFNAVRTWAEALSVAPYLRLEMREIRHRVQGLQRIPSSAWVDSIEDVLNWLGKRREWERFLGLILATRQSSPALLPWLEKRPLQALELADNWQQLLAVVDWLAHHPHPGIYLRQVDLPGIHTKFIEMHRGTLTELLDLVLPADAVDATKTGISQFAARYGFADKPSRIRFRVLDPTIQLIHGVVCPDITLDADSFSHLSIDVSRVFITENETNFLAFPNVNKSIVIFGAGYGWDALAKGHWLDDCDVYYWGDIDTHGFAILNQLRCHFPHVKSFLMDRDTLIEHAATWGIEPKQSLGSLPMLTVDERALYDGLQNNTIKENLRLEQEYIGYSWLTNRLHELTQP